MQKSKIVWTSLTVVGVVLVALGIGLGYGVFPAVIKNQVAKELDLLDTESEGYKNFESPPVPLYMKFYLFNVTNPDEVMDGQKPILTEHGPYAYIETRYKVDIENNTDAYIQAGQYKEFHFDKAASCETCEKTDEYTVINGPLVGFISLFNNEPGLSNYKNTLRQAIEDGMHGAICKYNPDSPACVHNDAWLDSLFMTTSVDALIFSGTTPGSLQYAYDKQSYTWVPLFPPQIDKSSDQKGFAAYGYKNATAENEYYEFETGANDNMDVYYNVKRYGPEKGKFYDDLTWADWWEANGSYHESNICNQLKGTDGQQFAPDVKTDDKLYIFQTDVCRSMFISYKEDQDISGIPAMRFVAAPIALQVNTTENIGFCMEINPDVDWDNCINNSTTPDDSNILDLKECFEDSNYKGNCFDGTLDITRCMGKAPIVVSSPHFYASPPELYEAIDGWSEPNQELHETQLDIEPTTGMAIKLHKRLQFNLPVYREEGFESLKNMPDLTIFPLLWVDEGADIDQENIDKLMKKVVTPKRILEGVKWTMIALGGLLFLLGGGGLFLG